jgi:outer membrane lipopolysaccharide assembly protein LptE/RlpB
MTNTTAPMNPRSLPLRVTLMAAALLAQGTAFAQALTATRCDIRPQLPCPAVVLEARTLRVAFAPSTTELQLRKALTRAGARIVGGPTQLGEYWLASSSVSLDEIKASLIRSGVAQSITVDLAGPRER